jgi:ELWxxDGT repeat protein
VMLFAAGDSSGEQLWVTDGGLINTQQVTVINDSGDAELDQLTAAGDRAFFQAYEPDHGVELWCSDGTVANTAMARDILTGPQSSNPTQLANLNGTLFFRATNGVDGYELWKSDCTESGTVLVRDIYGGPQSSSPYGLTASSGPQGNWVYFSADDGLHGEELWQSDGSQGGTSVVTDINPGPADASPDWITAIDGILYFAANDGTHGSELWKSDGTAAGTSMVMDINPGPSGSSPHNLAVVGDTLYFAATDGTHGSELWGLDIAPSQNIYLPLVLRNP